MARVFGWNYEKYCQGVSGASDAPCVFAELMKWEKNMTVQKNFPAIWKLAWWEHSLSAQRLLSYVSPPTWPEEVKSLLMFPSSTPNWFYGVHAGLQRVWEIQPQEQPLGRLGLLKNQTFKNNTGPFFRGHLRNTIGLPMDPQKAHYGGLWIVRREVGRKIGPIFALSFKW